MRLEQQLENYKNYVESRIEVDDCSILSFAGFVESLTVENDEFIKSFGTAFEGEQDDEEEI